MRLFEGRVSVGERERERLFGESFGTRFVKLFF